MTKWGMACKESTPQASGCAQRSVTANKRSGLYFLVVFPSPIFDLGGGSEENYSFINRIDLFIVVLKNYKNSC